MMKSDAVTGNTRIEQSESNSPDIRYYDAEFGGPEERGRLEKQLLQKIDRRMGILVVIYILNYVSLLVKLMWLSISSLRFSVSWLVIGSVQIRLERSLTP